MPWQNFECPSPPPKKKQGNISHTIETPKKGLYFNYLVPKFEFMRG
jgi:hypothetical protein